MGERYAPVVRGECGDGISSHHTRVGENCFSEIYKFIYIFIKDGDKQPFNIRVKRCQDNDAKDK